VIPARYFGAVKVLALALVVMLGGGALLWIGTNSVQVSNEGRAQVPGTVEFDGEDRRYDVFLSYRVLQGSNTPERLAGRVDCAIALAGDRYATIDGARQAVRTVSDTATSIGSFDGRRGRLSVSCDWDGARPGASNRFIVAKQRTITRSVSFAVFGLGGVLVLVGLLMIWRASRRP
jgi:hypothetical protein